MFTANYMYAALKNNIFNQQFIKNFLLKSYEIRGPKHIESASTSECDIVTLYHKHTFSFIKKLLL